MTVRALYSDTVLYDGPTTVFSLYRYLEWWVLMLAPHLNMTFQFTSPCQLTRRTFIFFSIVAVIFTCFSLVSNFQPGFSPSVFLVGRSFADEVSNDQRLLDCFTNGEWRLSKTAYSSKTKSRLDKAIRKIRNSYGLPRPLQRNDGRCGNLTFGKGLGYFRAVCDPFQSTPCCYQGVCRNVSVEKCSCRDCYDLRQTIHGELAEWVIRQPDCSLKNFTSEQACHILRDRTIVFIGDSYMRHLYIGLHMILSNNDVDATMKGKIKEDKRKHCKWIFQFTKECRFYVPLVDSLCRGTVTMYRYKDYTPTPKSLSKTLQKHMFSRETLFVIGIGIHFSFNSEMIISDVVDPTIKILSRSPYSTRSLVWILPHALGLLKSPAMKNQLNPQVKVFNARMRDYLGARRVTVMDAYNVTRKLKTYDGVHYPKASNILKAQILLNFIQNKDKM